MKNLFHFSLVTDIDLDLFSPTSTSPSKSDASDPDDPVGVHLVSTTRLPQACMNVTVTNISSNSSVAEDDELGDGLRTGPSSLNQNQNQNQQEQAGSSSSLARTSSLPWIPGQAERRRRKLPEIPKNKKCK